MKVQKESASFAWQKLRGGDTPSLSVTRLDSRKPLDSGQATIEPNDQSLAFSYIRKALSKEPELVSHLCAVLR
jgi:hypothetical protein